MRRLNDDGGAVAILVAVMMFALLGFGALAIDVGAMHAEVRQLQNVADAAALAIAYDCAEGDCGDMDATAEDFAVQNSNDSLSGTQVEPGPNPNTIKVTASTLDAAGGNDGASDTLGWTLAQALTVDERTFERSATAGYGAMGGGATIPIALCTRSWEHFTQDGTVLPSGDETSPNIVQFGSPNPNHALAEHQDCSNPSYDTYAGGFGFLQRDANCMAVSTELQWFAGSAGSNPQDPSSLCTVQQMYVMLQALVNSGDTALVPIFDAFRGTGAHGEFHIEGYGAFRLLGYTISSGPGGSDRRYGMANNECPNHSSCLKGYYTEYVAFADAASFGGSSSFGAYVVGLTD